MNLYSTDSIQYRQLRDKLNNDLESIIDNNDNEDHYPIVAHKFYDHITTEINTIYNSIRNMYPKNSSYDEALYVATEYIVNMLDEINKQLYMDLKKLL